MKKTIVLSLFPGCGKQKAKEFWGDKISIFDIFLLLYVYENRKKSKKMVKSPNYGKKTVKLVSDHMGKADFIFVSSDTDIRNALQEAGISFISVMPRKDQLNEWIGRLYREGSGDRIIKPLIEHWDEWLDQVEQDNLSKDKMDIYHLNPNEYLSDFMQRVVV